MTRDGPEKDEVPADHDRPAGGGEGLSEPGRPEAAHERGHEPDQRRTDEKDGRGDDEVDREGSPSGTQAPVRGARPTRDGLPRWPPQPAVHLLLRSVVETPDQAAQAGRDLVSQRRRLPGKRRAHRGARGDLLDQPLRLRAVHDALGQLGGHAALDSLRQQPLEAGAREGLLDEALSRLVLERSGDSRLEVRAREHLVGDSLRNAVIDDGSRERFRQRPRQSVVDCALDLGRGEHFARGHLELIPPPHAGVTALVGKALARAFEPWADDRRAGGKT